MADLSMDFARRIEWQAIGVACVHTFVAGIVVGFGWGLLGAFIMATSGPYKFADTVDTLEDGAYIMPFVHENPVLLRFVHEKVGSQ